MERQLTDLIVYHGMIGSTGSFDLLGRNWNKVGNMMGERWILSQVVQRGEGGSKSGVGGCNMFSLISFLLKFTPLSSETHLTSRSSTGI
jgi:hypothetical protein